MSSPIVCVRLPRPLHAALTAFCTAQGQQSSVVMRDALRDLLMHPERWPDIVLQRYHHDLQTTWEHVGEAEAFDIAQILAERRVDMGQILAEPPPQPASER